MAAKKMYALLDHTAQIFLNPINFLNDGEAIRWFTTVVNNKNEETNVNMYPESFTLYQVGIYNDKTGTFTSDIPKELIKGINVQDVNTQKYSLKDMMNMLKEELERENIIDLKEHKK